MPLQTLQEGSYTFAAAGDAWVTLNTTSPNTVRGYLQAIIDVSALAAGATLEVRVLEKVVAGGAQVVLCAQVVSGPIATALVTPAFNVANGWDVQVRQRTGTPIAIGYSLRM